MAAPLGHAGDHRQHRRGPLQRLDLRLLIDREDRRARRRRQVQPHHVADLVDEQRVRGDLEVLGAPAAAARRPARSGARWSARCPTRRASSRLDQCVAPSGHLFQGPDHHLLHLGIGDGARHPRPRLIAQPVQPPGQEPVPPLPHSAPADAQPRRYGGIAVRLRRRPARSAPAMPALARSSGAWPIPATSAARHPTTPVAPACYHPCPQQTANQRLRHQPPGL